MKIADFPASAARASVAAALAEDRAADDITTLCGCQRHDGRDRLSTRTHLP
ncbi:hypothetical protein [Streptomyces aureus]|uniref:Uncharacterized protein n=1 Tax=Streptomyces aureus TaxID=193461 RepID=A0ABV4T112_9ACTN